MYRKKIGRLTGLLRVLALPGLAAVIAVAAIGGAAPASAAPHTVGTVDPGDPNGTARFGEIEDDIYLCDHASDGHGVGVFVQYIGTSGNFVQDWYWYGGGDDGCRTIDLEVAENTSISYKVCLADHTEQGGEKPQEIKSTCSNWRNVINDDYW